MGWNIKQAAEKTGISADTLRYYDKAGIISPGRGENGYRQYDEKDISNLKSIVVMKYAHFSLAEMKSMEELYKQDPGAHCNEIATNILNAKLTALKQMIYNYQNIVAFIEELLNMTDSAESYLANAPQIDEFIESLFNDIKSGSLPQHASLAKEK